jgi:hypothetical protein
MRAPLRIYTVAALVTVVAIGWAPARGQAEDDRFSISPMARYIWVDGDEDKFREQWWRTDGWAGGVEEFSFKEEFDNNSVFHIFGHAIAGDEDYRVGLNFDKKDLGFIHTGFRNYRKYFDDTGGFYGRFLQESVQSFDLDRDLNLDIGNIFVDVGLTLPDLPRVVLGYEHEYKDGEKSLLEWGGVEQTGLPGPTLPSGDVAKKIFPSYKDIDETVDIFKAEVEHDLSIVHLADQFRYEIYSNDTTRYDQDRTYNAAGSLTSSQTVTAAEDFGHDALFNTFTADSWLTDKFYLSGGYLYSNLNGDAGLRLLTVPFTGRFSKDWFTRSVDLDEDSHVANFSTLVGPFAELTGYGGIQFEWTDTSGQTDAVLTEINFANAVESPEAEIQSDKDKDSFEGHAGLRYTGIPFTTFYAEGRWAKQNIDLSESELEEGTFAFRRDTDTDVWRQTYTVGVSASPISRVTLAARYRYKLWDNDYDHKIDEVEGASGIGSYSAFITDQEFETNQVDARITVRPLPRTSFSFKYQWVDTEYTSSDQPVPGLGVPAGKLESGEYKANIYSLNATVTPINRLYLTALLSYQDIVADAFDNGAFSVIPYNGDVLSIVAGAGYGLDDKTDLSLQYIFSWADNFENNGYDETPAPGLTNTDFGLPYLIDYVQQGLLFSASRELTEHILVGMRYGFYKYDESSNDHIDDYTAHLLAGFMKLKF